MSRRIQYIPLHLDARGIKSLSTAEIHAILRAADALIAVGGRSLLTNILRGGAFERCTGPLPGPKSCLWLLPEYAGGGCPGEDRLDDLASLPAGHLRWAPPGPGFYPARLGIERENHADEFVRGFDDMLAGSQGPYVMEYLKDRDRGMIMLVLDKVQASGDAKYLPPLDDWARVDYKKVVQRILEVKSHLTGRPA